MDKPSPPRSGAGPTVLCSDPHALEQRASIRTTFQIHLEELDQGGKSLGNTANLKKKKNTTTKPDEEQTFTP